ncbi:MAG: porphobilinogen deaminase [Alphaproteobacteria bacterium]|nr:MAG: porphobilinogen deaminase [Alphaproteobacteria bacterium]
MARVIRIGTRGSRLALAQADELKRRLMAANPGADLAPEVVVISTRGDRVTDRPLAEIGGKGLFTQEIEAQLADGRIDMAVHSSKDMPTVLPGGLELACFLPRENPADAFISQRAAGLAELPAGAVVGTASLRRQALVRRLRPDLTVIALRGNVETRLAKLARGEVDATLLAQAGLIRLGLDGRATAILPIDDFPPAPGQGAICVETRIGDAATAALLAQVNHAPTASALAAERAFLAGLDGSCRTPIAGHARIASEGRLDFHGMVLKPDGSEAHEVHRAGPVGDAARIGAEAAAALRVQAGPGFLAGWE